MTLQPAVDTLRRRMDLHTQNCFICQDWFLDQRYQDTQQICVKKFTNHIIGIWGIMHNFQVSLKNGLREKGREPILGFFLWSGDGAEVRVLTGVQGLTCFESPTSNKKGAFRLSSQLAQMWGRGKREQWSLEDVSSQTSKNGGGFFITHPKYCTFCNTVTVYCQA